MSLSLCVCMEIDSCHLVDGTCCSLPFFPTVWEWGRNKDRFMTVQKLVVLGPSQFCETRY
jgi:hypothetical protein